MYANDKWGKFFYELHNHPCFQTLKYNHTFAPKQTSLNIKSPSNMSKEGTIYGQVLTMKGNFIEI